MNENTDMPPTQLHLSNKLIALLVVLVIVVAGVSGAVGSYFYTSSTHQSYSATLTTPVLHNPTPPPVTVHTTAGTIASITGNILILKSTNTTVPNSTVLIDPSTKIIEFTIKNQKAFQAEVAAFTKANKTGSKATLLQPIMTTTTLSVADLSTGDRIMVTSTQNIAVLEKFTASKIQVYPKTQFTNQR